MQFFATQYTIVNRSE